MEQKNISFFWALFPILVLIGLLGTNVYLYGDDSLGGANQLALYYSFHSSNSWHQQWQHMEVDYGRVKQEYCFHYSSHYHFIIDWLFSGTWLLSGIVPAMIYYGLQILNPKIFLVATCIICAIVSLASGSSWSTIATIGIALLGIGKALGISEGLIGGAIISGAYFGDKMSPLSDTTNLAPAMAGTDLFTHIRYMMYTTIPSFIITLIIFLF